MSAAPVIARSLKYQVRLTGPGVELRDLHFDNQSRVIVGRGADCDISIPTDPKISRKHCELRIMNGELQVVNVSSKNYVYVNGRQVQTEVIKSQAEVRIGDALLEVKIEEAPQPQVNLSLAPVSSAQALQPGQALPNKSLSPSSAIAAASAKPGGLSAMPGAFGASTQQQASPRSTGPRPTPTLGGDSQRLKFYGAILIIGALGYWFLFSDSPEKAPPKEIRREPEIVQAINQSAEAVKELEKQRELENSIQYRAAQEHYIKGFRDYRNGQYGRAMQSFSAALSLYSGHELARRYYDLSKRKFDELVQFHMAQGRRYYGKMNYRLCRSSYANAMKMLKDPNNSRYREAKQYYDECSLRLGGRF